MPQRPCPTESARRESADIITCGEPAQTRQLVVLTKSEYSLKALPKEAFLSALDSKKGFCGRNNRREK